MTTKCASCGKFLCYAEMERSGGATFYFEPDSHKGPEVSEWTCAKCNGWRDWQEADEASIAEAFGDAMAERYKDGI